MTLFASLVFDRMPLMWQNLPDALCVWLQNAGGVAAFGILLVLLARTLQRDAGEKNLWNLPGGLQGVAGYLAYIFAIPAIAYTIVIVGWIGAWSGSQGARILLPRIDPSREFTPGDWLLTVGGAISLLIAVTPIAIDLCTRIRWGRIWAMARLSWTEAVRGRVVWVFGFIALIFLFAGWFVSVKPEDQLRAYVRVIYWSISPLFLLTAGILGSFSIPNDVKNNSIHTIVTKPVEKFEIVLGRFFGYGAILTIGLFVVASLSLLYVLRGVNEEAAKESFKARVPIYGTKLEFAGTKLQQKAESVGREWGYRSYITCPTFSRRDALRQYAVWNFAEVPTDLADGDKPVLFEFAFDIFRLSKGDEGEGVNCTFTFADSTITAAAVEAKASAASKDRDKRVSARAKDLAKFSRAVISAEAEANDPAERARLIQAAADDILESDPRFKAAIRDFGKTYVAETSPAGRDRLLTQVTEQSGYAIDRAIAAEHRICQVRSQVTDQHTQVSALAPGVLKILGADERNRDDPGAPALRVFMSVDVAREAQMVGVAHQDFYIMNYEMPFWFNFLKGVVGLWCTFMLVLGVSLACSTYLSSVISLLGTMFLFIAGLFVDYLKDIAEKKIDGGGPLESALRIGGHMPLAAKLEDSPTKTLVDAIDGFFSWWIGRVMNLIPNVNRHDLVQYVANGFDIGMLDVLLLDNVLPLAGYLIPWAILAYYLMKYREIANPT
jgi:hypothetical protein